MSLDELHAMPRAIRAPSLVGLGPIWDDVTIFVRSIGSNALRTSGGRDVGFTILAGQTGHTASIQPRLALTQAEVAALAGCTLRWTFAFNTSANFARRVKLLGQVQTASATPIRVATVLRNGQVTPTRRIMEFWWGVTGDEIRFQPLVQISNASPLDADEWIEIVDVRVELVATPSGMLPPADESIRAAHRRTRAAALAAAGALLSSDCEVIRTVRADGTGDHTTIAAALAAITDASASRRYLIKVGPGTYDETGLVTKDFVDIEGCGPKLTWVRGYLPPSAALGTVQSRSTFDPNSYSRLRGMRITAQNMRYALHPDLPTGTMDETLVVEDCELEHFGNQEVLDYQASIGGPVGRVWKSVRPWGSGTSSGQRMILRNCTLYARGVAPFLIHTNGDFARPSHVRLENCRLIDRAGAGVAICVQPLGSGQGDRIEIVGCTGNGALLYQSYGNRAVALAAQRADRAEIMVVGHGNSGMPYRYVDSVSRALRIESASTGGSSAVAIGGTAAVLLFGAVVQDVAGGGIAAAAYGTVDVASGNAGTSLGARLGDRSSASVTLTLTVDGGAPVNVVFNANHTEQSNATILGLINTALGAAATASLMDVTALYRPSFGDQEIVGVNAGTVAIPRRRAVARTAAGTLMPMTDTHPASAFVGLALETIPPGSAGRVQVRGLLHVETDLERADSASFVAGDTFGVASDGRWTKGATVPLVTAVNATDVKLSA